MIRDVHGLPVPSDEGRWILISADTEIGWLNRSHLRLWKTAEIFCTGRCLPNEVNRPVNGWMILMKTVCTTGRISQHTRSLSLCLKMSRAAVMRSERNSLFRIFMREEPKWQME